MSNLDIQPVTPEFHASNAEPVATEAVARQPIVENITEGIDAGPLLALGIAVVGVAAVLTKIKNKQGPLADIFKDKPYEQ